MKNNQEFISSFSSYEDAYPAGVKLPRIEIDDKHYQMLGLVKDSGVSNFDFLRKLCFHYVKEKGIDSLPNHKEYYERLKNELIVFNELSFVDYVLLNWDIINFCKQTGIPTGAGRGSAAGSLVLYVIGITNIDPLKYGLFFERFVSKSRARKIEHNGEIFLDGSLLCDVDNDISYDRRQEVIEYIYSKYKGKTAKISTLNTLSSKLCIKECGKIVAGLSEQDVNAISATIPKKFGKVAKLETAEKESIEFAKFAKANPRLMRIAKKLESLNKNLGVHPSGISISYYPLEEIMPVSEADGSLVAGYEMNDVADLTVKFDILGLRTLSVVNDVCKQLGISMDEIDCEHPTIYAALQCLDAPSGLFQIEADTNFKVVKTVAPKNIEQLSAVVAIARPGALDFLDRYAAYARTGDFQSVHEFFDDVLSYTGGIPLYQEQLMQMVVKVGFNLDEAEQIRRCVGKKKVAEMALWKDRISAKIAENKLDPVIGDVLWKVAEDSANYSFNKSHAAAYASLSAVSTYLKFNYPQEFFLSLLRYALFEPDPHAEITKISQELYKFDIKLLPPDLVKSKEDFSIEGRNIRYGLNCIKGVASSVLISLMQFREMDIQNKYDIFLAAKQVGLNIGVLSGLIQAGLLDSFADKGRCRLVLEAQVFNLFTDREKRNMIELGPRDNFDVLNSLVDNYNNETIADDGKKLFPPKRMETIKKKYASYKEIYLKNKPFTKLANWYFENKLLGYSYSGNIRDVFSQSFREAFTSSKQFHELNNNSRISVVGEVVDVVSRTSSNGNKYIKLDISDEFGKIPCLLMDNARHAKLSSFLSSGKKTPVKGDIAIINGSKFNDAISIDSLSTLEEKIYMKLSDLK